MAWPYSLIKTVVTGAPINAQDRQAEHNNHVSNQIPTSIDDYSFDTTEMQSTVDPFPAGSPSQATTLAGELERLRYVIKQLSGEAQWYIDPDTDVTTLAATQTDVNNIKSALNDSATAIGTAASVKVRVDHIVSQLKAITGGAAWTTAPVATIPTVSTSLTSTDTSLSYLKSNARNILVNGGFEVWQRGTSFSSPTNGEFTADRWRVTQGAPGGHTYTVDRESTTIDSGTYSLKFDITNAGAGALLNIRQDMHEVSSYKGKTLTASVRVKTSTTSAIRIQLDDDIGQSTSSYHTGGGAWETLTVTHTVSASATGVRLRIGFVGINAVVSTTYIDSAMVVIGSDALGFVPEDPAKEIARCQRYYQRQDNFGQFSYASAGAQDHYIPVHFAVPMSNAPTVTLSNGTTLNLTSAAAIGSSTKGFVLRLRAAGAGITGIGNAATPDGSWVAATIQ